MAKEINMQDWLTLMKEKLGAGDDASIDEVLNLLKAKETSDKVSKAKSKVKDWETFAEMLDDLFPRDESLDHPVWEYENFVPDKKHDVGGGAWIKVATEKGFNLYYAKQTKKKFSVEDIERKIKNIERKADEIAMQILKSMSGSDAKVSLLNKEIELRKQAMELSKEAKHYLMFQQLDMYPYTVKYQVSKTKWVTLYPYQYEVVSDIDVYVNRIIEAGKTDAVTYKSIFSSNNSDAVFYLQSRGISKDVAIMLCKLRDCYFIVNTMEVFQSYYGRMVIVEEKSA